MNKCVYFHINPLKNEVFYVGIGNKVRPFCKSKRSAFWNNIVSKYGYIIDVVHENLTCNEAIEKEKYYINFYGRKDLNKGSLVNLTDGGDGTVGQKDTLETKKRKSIAQKGNKRGFFKGMIPANKGVPRTKEQNIHHSNKLKGCTTWNVGIKNTWTKGKSLINSKGIVFESVGKAAIVYGIKRRTLSAMLVGQNKNKTDLRYE